MEKRNAWMEGNVRKELCYIIGNVDKKKCLSEVFMK